MAEPLYASTGDIVGAVAIKLDISELQMSWQNRGEVVLAVNPDGIVVISSYPEWLYQSVTPLEQARRASIIESRQFGTKPIDPLAWIDKDDGRVELQGQRYLLTSGKTELVDWTVHYLTREAYIRQQTLLATAVLGAFIAGLIGFSVFLRSQRIRAALTVSQIQRQELEDANTQLLSAQEELARSSKLAALGQLAASVTHELGQPISALKNHLFAAEIGNEITSPETLSNLRRLVDRMESISKQLRFFAGKGGDQYTETDMASVIDVALGLVRHDLDAADVILDWTKPVKPCLVLGNRLQLEQVMVNLLRNALNAVKDHSPAQIDITCLAQRNCVAVTVSDNGSGLQGQALETLQEPFYSTRSSGEGMGLGLAITTEIVRAHGGDVSADDRPGGGASFTVSVPIKGSLE